MEEDEASVYRDTMGKQLGNEWRGPAVRLEVPPSAGTSRYRPPRH